jgi:predicted DsbA family dithiol-disulfide isomerase
VEADIHFQPFELNPDMPPEGENTFEHVQKKYGATPERSAASRQALKDSGAAVGFAFNYGPDSRIWNTFDAHRLLHWAGQAGRQRELKEALFTLNFTEQKSTSDQEALVSAAVKAGLDEVAARDVLASGRYADDVRADEMKWRQAGINAVPSVVFEHRWLIQGGQPPEQFEAAIRQIVKERQGAGA